MSQSVTQSVHSDSSAGRSSSDDESVQSVTRDYNESIFVINTIDNVKLYTARVACVWRGKVKLKVYRDPLRPINIKRHWLLIHKTTVRATALEPPLLQYARTPAEGRALLVGYQLKYYKPLCSWDDSDTQQLYQPYIEKCKIPLSSAAIKKYLEEEHLCAI